MAGIKQRKYGGRDEEEQDAKLKEHLTKLLVGGKPTLEINDDDEED